MKAVALAMALWGCSAIATRSTPRQPGATCSGYVPAVVDAAITASLLVLAARSYRDNHCSGNDGCHNFDPTGLYVLPILGFGISTAWGVGAEKACRGTATP